MKKIIFVLCIVLISSALCFAQQAPSPSNKNAVFPDDTKAVVGNEIILKTGEKVVGKIINRRGEYILIDSEGKFKVFFPGEIKSIDGEKLISDFVKMNQALERAIVYNDLISMNALIERGADVNAKHGHLTMFGISIDAYHNTEAAKLLIEKGADVNMTSAFGITPLMFAAENKNIVIAKLLIEKGADVNAKLADFRTALSFAEKNKDAEMVKLLKQYGAKQLKIPLFVRIKKAWSNFLKIIFAIILVLIWHG